LSGRVSTASNVMYHADIVMRWSGFRRLGAEGKRFLGTLTYPTSGAPDEPQEMAAATAQRLFEIAAGYQEDNLLMMDASIEKLSEHATEKEEGKLWTITPAISDLSWNFGGWSPGLYCVLAGRPGMGKTAYALNEAVNVADRIRGSGFVIMFSFESSRGPLVQRLFALMMDMPLNQIKEAQASDIQGWLDDFGGNPGAMALKDYRIIIDDTGGLSPVDIDARITRAKAKFRSNPRLIIIDYLQRMKPSPNKRYRKRDEEVAAISADMHDVAKKHGAALLMLAQLNRQAELRDNKRPQMADLKESGAIEQDADVVILLYRPGKYGIKNRPGNCWLKGYCDKSCDDKCLGIHSKWCQFMIEKSRDGKTGRIVTEFEEEKMTFRMRAKSK
jgi:replicative DNA helicase